MSLILDALKRSEQERANNRNNPAVNIEISSDVAHQKSHSPWLALLVVLFVVALAVIIYLLLRQTTEVPDYQTVHSEAAVETAPPVAPLVEETVRHPAPTAEETFQAPEPAAERPAALKPPPLQSQRKPKPVNPVPLSQQLAKPKVVKKPAAKPPAPAPVTEKTQEVVTPPQQQAPAISQPEEPTSPATEEQTADNTVPVLSEIPDNDQMMFLNYEINTHFYSEKPGRSFALINMKKYRVGQFIDGSKMKIENITPEGVVVNYGRGTVLLRSY